MKKLILREREREKKKENKKDFNRRKLSDVINTHFRCTKFIHLNPQKHKIQNRLYNFVHKQQDDTNRTFEQLSPLKQFNYNKL